MTRAARTALMIWAAITVLIAASLLWIYLRLGTSGFDIYIRQPPLTNLPVTLASVGLLWLSIGVLLGILRSGRVRGSNLPVVGGFFVVCWAYLNILSERWRYGDYTYYFEAASRMHTHQPLPDSYFYPPFWATVTQFLAPLGVETFFIVLWLLNFVALLLFYVLLHRTLQRYGFATPFAAAVTTLFILANTPLLRTLFYVQVNLHTLNLVLLSLLLYPRRSFLSALSLALAVHLKSSPAVLVLAFLLEKDWRWVGWFILSLLGIAALTLATNGFSPFLEVVRNLQGLAASNNTIFHNTSFDSFLLFTGQALNLGLSSIIILVYLAKALLAAATVAVMLRCVRLSAFVTRSPAVRGGILLNAVPPLFILMTLASPVVWEHHGLFLALSFLLMLKRVEQPSDWLLFSFAYLLEFLLPTFDFFPWSYGRLLAPLIILWLMWKTAARPHVSASFVALNGWLQRRVESPEPR